MKTPAFRPSSRNKISLGATALLAAGALMPLRAADLVKADNTTDLGTAGSYAAPNDAVAPTVNDRIVFNGTLVNNAMFSWLGSGKSIQGVKLDDPTNDITVNVGGGATYGFTNSGGPVIDMSNASKNLTFAGNGILRLRGDATNGATISVASGRTLNLQAKLTYNNGSGLANIRVAGAGNMTVSGTYGVIQDKDASNFASFTHDGTGTVTFSNANTYSGGTALKSGTLVAGAGGALGNGAVVVSGGALDLNGANALTLSLASGKSFAMSSGTLNFSLGSGSDQIAGAGSAGFALSGGTLALTLGAGFDYNTDYQLFVGFDGGLSSVSGLAITGYDTANYTAALSTAGLLEFTALSGVPEPSSLGVVMAGVSLAAVAARRRQGRRN